MHHLGVLAHVSRDPLLDCITRAYVFHAKSDQSIRPRVFSVFWTIDVRPRVPHTSYDIALLLTLHCC